RAGQVTIVVATAVIHANEPLRLVVRERLQDDRIQDAEYGGVGSRAQRQRDDDDRGETRRDRYRTNGVLEVEEHTTPRPSSTAKAAKRLVTFCGRTAESVS